MSLKNKKRAATRLISESVKSTYQFFRYRPGCVNRYIFIVGCQRSGTTMLGQCFDRDYQVKEYGEYGLSGNSLRIPALDVVENIAAGQRAPVFVAKPLVESQRTNELLKFFPNSTAIWMLRHYRDVANSSFRKFGVSATIRNLGAIVENNRSHWMAECASDAVREVVRRYYRENMPPLDGKALIWYVRNVLYFEQRLEEHDRVRTVFYNDIVSNPHKVMQSIYRFAEIDYPGEKIVSGIHNKSVGLGRSIEIDWNIENLCEELWQRLLTTRITMD